MALESWDDLRVLLAAAREGTLTEAAKALRLNQTTVTRRLRALEARAGVRLFDRLRGGIELTPAAEVYARAAADLEERVHAAQREVDGGSDLAGTLRFTLPELLAHLWMPALTAFASAHPQVQLEVISSYTIKSLTRREADVALRFTTQPPDHLVGRKLTTIAVATYAAQGLDPVPFAELPWVGWDPREHDDTAARATRHELGAFGPHALFVSDYMAMIRAMQVGAGAGILPCIVGDRDQGLVRRSEPRLLAQSLWILTHPDLRRSARVRALMGEITSVVLAEQRALQGIQ